MILLYTVTGSDTYDNYSYTSCIDWEIEKSPEAHQKKLEFYIDKPETGLKKIDFNINVNDDETDDMNDEEAIYPSDDIIDDDYNTIEYHGTQHKQTNRNNTFYTLVDNEL